MVKFLIIRLSSIGDIVLTSPVIRCLKKQMGEADIHFLVKRQFLPVISANPHINKIHVLDNNLYSVINNLRHEHFDYIIDLHKNIRSFFVKSRLKIMSFSVNKINVANWLMVNLKINLLPDKHLVDRYLETLKVFDIQNDNAGLDYFIKPGDEVNPGDLPESFNSDFIALAVGGKHATKQMPSDMIIDLCKALKSPVVLLGGPEDQPSGRIIADKLGKHVFNGCGKFNINQSASLVRQAQLLITPDTGIMHIGAGFKKIILSVWGNTIPEFGMYPYISHPSSRIFEVEGLSCRPCSKIGYSKCPRGHFRCIKDINVNTIADYANKLTVKI